MFEKYEIERAITVITGYRDKLKGTLESLPPKTQLGHIYNRDIESLEITIKVLEFVKPREVKCFTYTHSKNEGGY